MHPSKKWVKAQLQSFTTGQAAKVCHISIQSIIRAVDRGILPAKRLPSGRSPRLIARNDLIVFMGKFGVPTGLLSDWEAENSPPETPLRGAAGEIDRPA